MSQPKLSEEQLTQLKAAFDETDTNKDGLVQKDELKNLIKKQNWEQSEEFLNELMTFIDENGDGAVDFSEFCKAMTE